MEINIKPLDSSLVHQANMNSMGGKRGDLSVTSYEDYCNRVLSWPIADEKKQKIVDQIYQKCSEKLRHEAMHVSWAVAGPAKYDARKLDRSDTILRLSSEFVEWFDGLEKQVKAGTQQDDKRARLLRIIEFADSRPELDPTGELAELSMVDNAKFVELFEAMQPKYKWRKNSNIYKLYLASKEGKVKEIKPEVFFEDQNLYFAADYRDADSLDMMFVESVDEERSLGPDGRTGVIEGIDYSADDGPQHMKIFTASASGS